MPEMSRCPLAGRYLPDQPMMADRALRIRNRMLRTTETRRRRAIRLCISVSLWFLPSLAIAQSPPDFSGFWNNQYTPNLATALGHEPPYTPFGLDRWKNVDTQNDPTGKCLPVGPSRAFTAPMP